MYVFWFHVNHVKSINHVNSVNHVNSINYVNSVKSVNSVTSVARSVTSISDGIFVKNLTLVVQNRFFTWAPFKISLLSYLSLFQLCPIWSNLAHNGTIWPITVLFDLILSLVNSKLLLGFSGIKPQPYITRKSIEFLYADCQDP